MEKSLRTTAITQRHTTATQHVLQRTRKPSWREKVGDVWQKIFGDTKSTKSPPLNPPWTDTGTYTFEITGQKTGDTASDDEIAMQMLEKDWDSYGTTIYTDCAATHCNANGGSGIIVTTGPPVTQQSTVSALSQLANGACVSELKRKLCELSSYWYRRMSLSTRHALFQIVCQHSNK